METTAPRFKWLNTAALLLVLPTTCFIFFSVLKYNLGIDGPFDSVYPWLERMGIKESLGWNINALIIFGPLIALLAAVLQVLGIEWNFTKEQFDLRVTIQRKRFPLVIIGISGIVLVILMTYLVAENFL
jgi:hypothetical protein